MNTIVKMAFGSHLYGTAGPDSDRDYKGIFMPSAREVMLGRIPKSVQLGTKQDSSRKNAPGDVDYEAYSLHYFVELACKGETVALDMLHAPASALEASSLIWASLVSNREKFYTRNLRSLASYARRQAAKYGVKGSRLADARQVFAILEAAGAGTKIGDLELPELEHARWLEADLNGVRSYSVCGKMLQETARAEHYVGTMRKFVQEYGHRAQMAEANQGIDWKAISHAFRAAYQVRYILTDRGFTYPLPETDLLVRVKSGAIPFAEAGSALEDLIAEVEALSESSPLPEKVDRAYWDRWLEGVVTSEVLAEVGRRWAEHEESWKAIR